VRLTIIKFEQLLNYTEMRKIRIFEHMSLDGVIEHDKNYAYPAWINPYWTPEGMAKLFDAYGNNFDLLLGRRTTTNFWATGQTLGTSRWRTQ
jgi:hypothetical protein